MPYFYDVFRSTTSNASGGTESSHLWFNTAANQEAVYLNSFFAAARVGSAGGNILRLKSNTGTVASGGTANTPGKANLRGDPAAQSTWFDDTSAITPGTTLKTRIGVGFAATGGMGGWQASEARERLAAMPNGTNPVDYEWTSIAANASVNFDLTVKFSEGA